MLEIKHRRYETLESLLEILDEGHLKLVKGSWLAKETSGRRFLRQQDLPKEAFWSASELRCHLRSIVVVGVSYAWLDLVHPDPKGMHLSILRHALKLRLRVRGQGRVSDVALFVDFMSL